MDKMIFAALAGAGLALCGPGAACARDGGGLSRDQAIAQALTDDPGLAAAAQGVRAADAWAKQAALRPNPTLDVQIEDFGGSGAASGLDGAEATYALTQQFELGGDRRARRSAAEREADAARLRAGLSEIDLIAAVETAFVEAQAAQAYADLAALRLDVARRFSETVERRVEAARDSEAARARVAARLAEADIGFKSAQARASAARAALASYWGGSGDFALETASFFNPTRRASQLPGASPDIALAEALRDTAAAEVDVERARRTPDPSVRAGFRQLRATEDSAFVVGISVPLPVWNRNSGAIAAARANERRAEFEVARRTRELARETAYLSSQLEAAQTEIAAYADTIIPSSERALEQSLRAYRQGGVSYIEVLDAQNSLALARERQITALLTYHRADAKLARLNGAGASGDLQETFQ